MNKDSKRLRAAWQAVDKIRKEQGLPRLSQKELAKKYKNSPALVGHYLSGRETLNEKWKIRFAAYLGVPITEIWPDFPHCNFGVPEYAMKIAFDFLEMDLEGQDVVRRTIAALPRRARR